ncbi:MAG: hypothetical protein WBQ11_12750 [Isosphaeraceae bacterium]
MTLMKNLIDIPERVYKDQYVLRLSEGVTRPIETLSDYVVTPELITCFDAALSMIRSAVANRTSKAAFLHGSFGTGKSHYMAVLHLILQGNLAARGIVELAPVIQKHNDWLAGKKFLLVPYHMIGAHDIESGVLGHYVEFIRKAHPGAPIPPVYVSATIISQAAAERANYGDEPFFRRLNAGAEAAEGWGDLQGAWDCRVVRGSGRSSTRLGAPPASCQYAAQDSSDLPCRGAQPARRELRPVRQGPLADQSACEEPGLRCPDLVPGRADPLAGHEFPGPGIRQARGGEAHEFGGSTVGRSSDSDRQLRGPTTGPPRTRRRSRPRRRETELC